VEEKRDQQQRMSAGSVEVVDIGRMNVEVEEEIEVVEEDIDAEVIQETVVDLHQEVEEAAEAIQEMLIVKKADVSVVKRGDTFEPSVRMVEVEIHDSLIEDVMIETKTVEATDLEMLPVEESIQEADLHEKDVHHAETTVIDHLVTHQELDLPRVITTNAMTAEVPHAGNVTFESIMSIIDISHCLTTQSDFSNLLCGS
jgi:hypothetical protein